jgi:hypothetical protein
MNLMSRLRGPLDRAAYHLLQGAATLAVLSVLTLIVVLALTTEALE